ATAAGPGRCWRDDGLLRRRTFLAPRLGARRAFALGALALELAGAADRGGALAGTLFGRLLVVTAQLHLAVDALALQLLLERAQRLLDVIVANDDLHKSPSHSCICFSSQRRVFAGSTISAVRGRPRRRAALSRRLHSVQPVPESWLVRRNDESPRWAEQQEHLGY